MVNFKYQKYHTIRKLGLTIPALFKKNVCSRRLDRGERREGKIANGEKSTLFRVYPSHAVNTRNIFSLRASYPGPLCYLNA